MNKLTNFTDAQFTEDCYETIVVIMRTVLIALQSAIQRIMKKKRASIIRDTSILNWGILNFPLLARRVAHSSSRNSQKELESTRQNIILTPTSSE